VVVGVCDWGGGGWGRGGGGVNTVTGPAELVKFAQDASQAAGYFFFGGGKGVYVYVYNIKIRRCGRDTLYM